MYPYPKTLRPALPILVAAVALASSAMAQQPEQTTTVTYRSGANVYVGAGTKDGLKEGDSLRVIRKAEVTALLRVAYLSSRQASCEILSSTADPVVGDTVRFTPHPVAAAPAQVAAAERPAARRQRSSTSSALRGRLGVRYLSVQQQDGSGTGFSQPALDMRLDGHDLLGSPVGLVADVRTRRTYGIGTASATSSGNATRVYQAVMFLGRPGAPFRLAVGRQYSPALATVSLFDGALAEMNRSRFSVGLFGGTQPSLGDLSYSGDVQEYGGYFQLHDRQSRSIRWSVTLGGVGSYAFGKADREFAFLQAVASAPNWSLYAAQEVDYYRSWKVAAGEPSAISPTSTYATGYLRLSRALSLTGGYDNRRTVRLYRDVVNPITVFDDAYRQGVWGGLGVSLGPHLRMGADVRSSRGGAAGPADAYTGSLSLERLTSFGLGLRTRSTRYTTPSTDGWLHAANVGINLFRRSRLDVNLGLRDENSSLLTGSTHNRLYWGGLDLELGLSNAWDVLLSGTRQKGDLENDVQWYGGMSYRF